MMANFDRGLTHTHIHARNSHTYIHMYIQKSQMKLASGTGSPGWSRARLELVCCEASGSFAAIICYHLIKNLLSMTPSMVDRAKQKTRCLLWFCL